MALVAAAVAAVKPKCDYVCNGQYLSGPTGQAQDGKAFLITAHKWCLCCGARWDRKARKQSCTQFGVCAPSFELGCSLLSPVSLCVHLLFLHFCTVTVFFLYSFSLSLSLLSTVPFCCHQTKVRRWCSPTSHPRLGIRVSIALNADLKSIIQIVVNPLPLIGLRHVVNRKALFSKPSLCVCCN